ncbi:MAG: cation transporting ATPase C-terminal domain-containing protein, partial [Deltaproteobacteria bacterium]|nr:cation transporting ATPase C-terminal domain-containing protein [Deltaproteobacteria bacterium]
LVSVHLPIAGLALIPALLGWPQLIGPLQVVVLELVIDPASSIVFELEPADERVMERRPRKASEHIFTRTHLLWSLALGLVAFAGVFTTLALARADGASEASQRSLALVTLVVGNLALLLASRSDAPLWHALRHRKNRGVPILIGATLSLVGLLVFVPPIRDALSLGPLSLSDLALTLACGVLPVFAVDALKSFRRAPAHPTPPQPTATPSR